VKSSRIASWVMEAKLEVFLVLLMLALVPESNKGGAYEGSLEVCHFAKY
jgi:hypothetical protein